LKRPYDYAYHTAAVDGVHEPANKIARTGDYDYDQNSNATVVASAPADYSAYIAYYAAMGWDMSTLYNYGATG